MGPARILTEMFLPEATLEFPDSEIAAVTRMIQSNERAGRIPRGAAENWPIVQGAATSRTKPTPKASPTRPAPRATPTPAGRDLSGRGVPAQSSLRGGDGGDGKLSHEPPSGLKKYMGGKGGSKPPKDRDRNSPEHRPSAGPSALKRLYSKARGKDPETGLPVPKSAVTRVPGGGPTRITSIGSNGPQPSSNEDPLADYPNKEPVPVPDGPTGRFRGQKSQDEPLFNVPGITGQPDTDDAGDEKVAAIKRGLSGALPNVPRRKPPSFPEADVWDRFAGMTGHQEPAAPAPQKKQQGRLSRLFKGRRDDDI